MASNRLKRIIVVGTSGCGKTTFARSLGEALNAPHVEFDALYWGPDWTPVPPEQLIESLARAISEDTWIVDGNIPETKVEVWQSATTIVWLNYPFPLVFRRAIQRTFSRIASREELYAGNRESISQVFDPGWIPWWVVRTFWRRQRAYREMFSSPRFKNHEVIELRKPSESADFLSRLQGRATTDTVRINRRSS